MATPEEARDVAVRLLGLCEERFAGGTVPGTVAEVASVLVDGSWNPERWWREHRAEVEDVLRHTRDVDAPIAVVIAAVAMLEVDRFALMRAWQRSFQSRDLITIAAAACERLPELP